MLHLFFFVVSVQRYVSAAYLFNYPPESSIHTSTHRAEPTRMTNKGETIHTPQNRRDRRRTTTTSEQGRAQLTRAAINRLQHMSAMRHTDQVANVAKEYVCCVDLSRSNSVVLRDKQMGCQAGHYRYSRKGFLRCRQAQTPLRVPRSRSHSRIAK